jgi:hypothetical protein
MVAQLAVGLKPKALKIKEVRLRILNELRKEARTVKKEFEKTTATWKGAKPTFEIAIGLTGKDATVVIGPAGNQKGIDKWIWLNDGTKPHPIAAKNVPNLIFRDGRGFKPKTKVKTFSSGPGANVGKWIKKPAVKHPGIEARDWTGEIVRKRRKPFTKNMIKAAEV